MKCLNCESQLQWVEIIQVQREKEWIKKNIISPESGTESLEQVAARYNCPDCGDKYDTKYFVMKNQPGGAKNPEQVISLCEDLRIHGLGWGGNSVKDANQPPSNAKEAAAIFDNYYDGKTRMDVRDFTIWMEPGDFVFTHNPYHNPTTYYQSRVTGDLQTPHNPDATHYGEPIDEQIRTELLRQDINLYREAEWKQIPRHKLPGILHRDVPIKNGTIRKINSNITVNAARNAERLWDGALGSDLSFYKLRETLSQSNPTKVINCLNENELEEIVSSFIQDKEDAVIQLNTYGSSQPDTEAILRASVEGYPHTIYFQVKSDSDPTDLGDLGVSPEVSLFVYAGGKNGEIPHAKYISNQQIYSYLLSELAKVPPSIRDTLGRQLS